MTAEKKQLIIAIDGHSSTGKSTVAKELAKKLKYTYIDSGAMYRAITLLAINHQLLKGDEVNQEGLKKVLPGVKIHFTFDDENKEYLTWLNDSLVEDRIRTIEVSDKVSPVSKIGFVREQLVKMQQDLGKNGGIVMDGRDIGTVVFPDADLKIFMTASSDVRAKRRFDELQSKKQEVSFNEVKANIEKRDYIDQNREISPLKKADDAIVIDNSNLSKEEQLKKIVELVEQKFR